MSIQLSPQAPLGLGPLQTCVPPHRPLTRNNFGAWPLLKPGP